MEFLPTMHLHSAIGLQLLALPSTLILCFTSMLRERSIGDRDEKRLVRLYKQHAFVLELVQLAVTLMAFGFATGNTIAAFEARSLVIDHASEEVTRAIVKSALGRDAWLFGSAVCILACVNMLDSWSLPESTEDLIDPLFRLTRTLIGAYLGPRNINDESQFFFCDDDTFTEDLERSGCSKKSTTTHSLADLPTKKPTSESSDSDETITQPHVIIKTAMDNAPRPVIRNNSKTAPLDSFPRLHPSTQNPSLSPTPSKKAPPHYQDQTMSSSIRSSTSSTSFTSLASSTSFTSSFLNNSAISSSSSASFTTKPSQHSSPKSSHPVKPSLSRSLSFKKPTSRTISTSTKAKANDKKKLNHRTRKRSVTFDLNPAVFHPSDASGGSGDSAVSPNAEIQAGVVQERVRELEMGESVSSGEFEVRKQAVVEREEGKDSDGYGDDGDDNGEDWEEDSEPSGVQEGNENQAAMFVAEEEEALVRKQRPSIMVQRESGITES